MRFDMEAFACALDSKRFANRMTWADVAKEVGISKATVSRVCWRKNCDLNSVTRLIVWLGQPFEHFIIKEPS